MASEISGEHLGYDELGVHRHLVVSERLRLRRRTLGLTQKEVVARLRRLGVSTTNKSLSSLEHGAGLDVGKLPELARALECTLTYLVGLTDDPRRWQPDAAHWAPVREDPAPVGTATATSEAGHGPARPTRHLSPHSSLRAARGRQAGQPARPVAGPDQPADEHPDQRPGTDDRDDTAAPSPGWPAILGPLDLPRRRR